ncbi:MULTISPECIES: nicotinate-nucleotide adenylyltransferase [unclassified Aureimonas]|uniref:nicotinate-nucleotide adenylyltransferase n=1 Tax=unclassified Aureimonas TaxID=2615206 RepID=UPI0006FB541B|nr:MULTISPECIES: nicotinate-nucleotide adenylyltransferase [unclassified Aureimonas]KQT65999.1 nicotinate-nicotinamide nucleotide adenylyltransferase [Aureimonas sp. Leaf427]KQT73357.1 nicotinate-nicotinamide nucleotide adenylyltransferase [Aureimonas sp. Leaf460]
MTSRLVPGSGAEDLDRAALVLPHVEPGMAVGLLGGSFNPPHPGHRLVAELALRRLELDQVWWMVTPGNPLKDHGSLRPLAERVAASRVIAKDPRIFVTAFEARYRVRYTADTLALLHRLRPDVTFVWIMGADSLASFHRWQDWRGIAATTPIAVVDRPGATLSLLSSPAALTLARSRIRESEAGRLKHRKPPAWVFLHGPRSSFSSSALRAGLRPTS